MHNYTVTTIFTKDQINELWDLYHETPVEYAYQDYNLFNVEKRILRPSVYKKYGAMKHLDDMMYKQGLKTHSHYFLKYPPNSFTRLHQDNKSSSTKTVVTFLETHNLKGGETIVLEKHFDLPQPENTYCKRTRSVHGESVVPVILPSESGSSLIYNWNITHGVGYVHQGHRIVLISWYVPFET